MTQLLTKILLQERSPRLDPGDKARVHGSGRLAQGSVRAVNAFEDLGRAVAPPPFASLAPQYRRPDAAQSVR